MRTLLNLAFIFILAWAMLHPRKQSARQITLDSGCKIWMKFGSRPFINERLLMGRKESNQTNKAKFGHYSKSCMKRPFSKRPKVGSQDQLSLNSGQKYCRMLQGEHSATLSTFIKLLFVIKIFVLSFLKWPLKTGFTVLYFSKTHLS